jgi:hypothetical protein
MTDKEHRIKDIVNRLDSLTLEANTLTSELKELLTEDTTQNIKDAPTYKSENRNETRKQRQRGNQVTKLNNFEIGNRVYITNKYRGKQGIEGKITYVTTNQVTLTDEAGKKYVRKYTNVRKIR